MPRIRPVCLVVIGIAVAVVSACAAQGGLDVDALELRLAARVLPSHPDLVGTVTCPDPLDPVEGDRVECQWELGDQTALVVVTFGAERGEITDAIVTSRLVDMDEAEALLAERFARDLGVATSVNCPQPVMVVQPGEEVVCTATDGNGVTREIGVRPGDDGAVDVRMIG